MINRKSNNNTGYKGIYYRKIIGSFEAKIAVKLKHKVANIHIGSFETLKEAVKAREEFIKSLF